MRNLGGASNVRNSGAAFILKVLSTSIGSSSSSDSIYVGAGF